MRELICAGGLLLSIESASGAWIAFNDHAPGVGTHANTTRYHVFGNGYPTSGLLRNITTGASLSAGLTIARSASGVTSGAFSAQPATGTPAWNVFYSYVDFTGSPDSSAELAGAGVVTYTFSNLNPSMLYRVHGSAVRGDSGYINRWTLCEIVGADAFTAIHSGNVLTHAQVASLSDAQAAFNSGANHTAASGDYVAWEDVRPGADGSFSITCRQYTGTVPGGSSGGSKGYALTGVRLEEYSTDATEPAIVTQPADQLIYEGQGGGLTADATGNPLFYQWFKNGVAITGATDRVFSITCASSNDTGAYAFVVSNELGTATSDAAQLSVISPQVVVWGREDYGQKAVPFSLSNVTMIAAGSWHGLALQGDGKVVGWGRNDSGQANIPADVTNAVAIAGGFYFSMALLADRTVRCWGDNSSGQRNVPLDLHDTVMIAAGYNHALALGADGRVTAWGNNSYGQSSVPAGLSNVVRIFAGGQQSLAVKADGTVAAWGGYDRAGQVSVPSNVSNVLAMAGTSHHTLALQTDGTVLAWGNNGFGQTSVPPGLSDVVAIEGGNGFDASHSLALQADGTVVAWGYDNFGQATKPVCLQQAAAIGGGEYYSMLLNNSDETSSGPVIVGAPFVSGVVGWPIWHRFGLRNGPAELRATGLPPELNIDPVTGILSGLPASAGEFPLSLTASNALGVTTYSITLVLQPNANVPVVVSQPQDQIATEGGAVILKVTAGGPLPAAFHWYFNGALLAGETNASLAIGAVELSDAGSYRVKITSSGGSVWSDFATLEVWARPEFLAASAWFDSAGQVFHVNLEGLSGYDSVIIEASEDLQFWQPVYTNTAPRMMVELTLESGMGMAKFFRAVGTLSE